VALRKQGAEDRIAAALQELRDAWQAWDQVLKELGK
jgi:hypothetical protein